MTRLLYNVADRLIFVICLPFYAVAIPLALVFEWLIQMRPVRLGQHVVHWPAKDIREDYLVVDVSRIHEGLVGIQRRRWGILGWRGELPVFSDTVEFISIRRFWVPRPLFTR